MGQVGVLFGGIHEEGAASGTKGAPCGSALDEPVSHPGLHILLKNGPDRADLGKVPVVESLKPPLSGCGDTGATPPLGHRKEVTTQDLVAEAKTTEAEDTPLPVQEEVLAERNEFLLPVSLIVEPPPGEPKTVEPLLKEAGARLIALGAVQGVLGEVKLQNLSPCLLNTLGLGENLHSLLDGGCTSGLKLWETADLHQAHPAEAGGFEEGVVAEIGNRDANLLGRRQDGASLFDAVEVAVEGDLNHGFPRGSLEFPSHT